MLDTRGGRDDAVVSVQGDIDLTTFGSVESALDAVRVGVTVLVLDLREVDFMDTSGLRLVISDPGVESVVPDAGDCSRSRGSRGHPPFGEVLTEPGGG